MHKRSLALTAVVACALAAPLVARIPAPATPQQEMEVAAALELGIDENMFTVNRTTRFLVFDSYFDAMDVSATNLHSDFAYQEPQRLRQANQSWLNRQGFGADVRGAYVSGAAAWCFHNGGGFRMDGLKLQSKLQAEEKSFLTCLVSYVYSGSCQ